VGTRADGTVVSPRNMTTRPAWWQCKIAKDFVDPQDVMG
jgi:hypothetical protein